jgi:integrase
VAILVADLAKLFKLKEPKTMPDLKKYKLAKLIIPEEGSKDQRWYVCFYALNVKTNKLQRKRYFKINDIKNLKKREKHAKDVVIPAINKALKDGFVLGLENRETKMNMPKMPKLESVTLLEAVTWAVNIKKGDSERNRTKGTYSSIYNNLQKWIEDYDYQFMLLKHLSEDHAFEYEDWLLNVYTHRGKRIKNRTFNNYIQFVSAIFNVFVNRKILEKNPFDVLKDKTTESSNYMVYSVSQKKQLKEYFTEHDKRLLIFVQFIFFTLARPAELCRIKLHHIKDGAVFIPSFYAKTRGGRTIPILKPILNLLYKEIKIQDYPSHYFLFGKDGKPSNMEIQKNYFSKIHTQLLRKLNYGSEYKLYGWKHTGASALYEKTKDILLIRDLCGHSSVSTTEQYLRDLGVLIDKKKLQENTPEF